jgi:hypothetical protein
MPVLELEATDVTEASWEELASQMAPDFPVEMMTHFCSTDPTYCDCTLDCDCGTE